MSERAPWLVGWGARPEARLTLVVVPQALGGPSAFRPWLALLPPAIDLRVANFPGRERRVSEPPVLRLETLADEVARAASEIPTPIALLGHSQGAMVAFEAARRLEAAGIPLVHLFASGCWAPHRNRPHPGLPSPDDDDAAVLASLIAAGGVPEALLADESMVGMLVALWRADAAVTRQYRCTGAFPPLAAPLTALGAVDDQLFRSDGLAEWGVHTRGRFETRLFPGDHFYLLSNPAPVVEAVVAALGAALGITDEFGGVASSAPHANRHQ